LEISKTFDPDLAIGTVAMWIDRPRPGHPVVCTAVPIRELEINLGPFGEIDDRFRVRFVRNSDIQAELGPEIYEQVPQKYLERIKEKPAGRTRSTMGLLAPVERSNRRSLAAHGLHRKGTHSPGGSARRSGQPI
jgi:hypothetical protein